MTLLGLILAVYFAPAFIASIRRQRQAGAILALNLFLGWTVVGWVAALVMALWNDRPETQNAPAQH
jgi:hypothetical protein